MSAWTEIWDRWQVEAIEEQPIRSDAGYHIWLRKNYHAPKPLPRKPTVTEAAWELFDYIDKHHPLYGSAVDSGFEKRLFRFREALKREAPRGIRVESK